MKTQYQASARIYMPQSSYVPPMTILCWHSEPCDCWQEDEEDALAAMGGQA